MEKVYAFEKNTLLIELSHGRDVVNQLKNWLDQGGVPESTWEDSIEKILSNIDNALAMLSRKGIKEEASITTSSPESGMLFLGSPPQPHSPVAGSTLSEVSNGASKYEKCHKSVCKKRKTSPQLSQQVLICSKREHDGISWDDGYNWRKYGQKDILGANYPRAYYRCTHRNSRGCLATKQVQRTDEDPSILEVIYKGKHSCNQTPNSCSKMFSDAKETSKPKKSISEAEEEKRIVQQSQQMLLNFGQGLKVETQAMNTEEEIFPSFSFSFTGAEFENRDGHFFSDADLMDGCSPTFLSPTTTSESNYFSSPRHMDSFGLGNILQSSKYDHTDITSTPTSVINSPFADLDFFVDQVDLDSIAYFA